MTGRPVPPTTQPENDWPVGWLSFDGYPVGLTDEQAWALAWGLIGACVQKRQEARAAVSSPERKPE